MDLSPTFPEPAWAIRDATLAAARDALRVFGTAQGFLAGHLCGCGRADCANDRVATMSMAVLLHAVAEEWTAAPDPASEPVLRERLLAFARVFGLTECPCDDPACPIRRIEEQDARGVVRLVADAWHGRAGNRVHHSADLIAAAARDYPAHLATLGVLALRLDPDDAAAFLPAVAVARAMEWSAWMTEARAMTAEAIATWLPGPARLPEVRRVLDGALAVAYHGDWTTADAAAFERAAADACAGILVRGFVHPSVTDALFVPLGRVVVLEDLDAAVDAYLLAEGIWP